MVDLTEADQGHSNSLEDRLNKLERAFRSQLDKGVSDDLMFARTREEIDTTSNRSKEDRIVINGLTSPNPLPTDSRLRIEALKGIVAETFEKIVPGF